MDLKSFLKTAVRDIVGAMEESSKELNRNIHVEVTGDNKSVEFDIAVTAETAKDSKIEAGIRVLEFFGFGSEAKDTCKQSEISRIKFRAFVASKTLKEEEESKNRLNKDMNRNY